jgi:hypothetical protein
MAIFKDATGREWRVSFDAFLLDDIRKETEIDLADVASGGWLKIETDSVALARVAAVAFRDELKTHGLTPAQFVKQLRGDAIERVRQALIAEGSDFFPQSEWSAIRSNLKTRKESKTQAEQMRSAMEVMELMGPDFLTGARTEMLKIAQQAAREGMSSRESQAASLSAPGPDDTLSTNATDAPGSVESPPEG